MCSWSESIQRGRRPNIRRTFEANGKGDAGDWQRLVDACSTGKTLLLVPLKATHGRFVRAKTRECTVRRRRQNKQWSQLNGKKALLSFRFVSFTTGHSLLVHVLGLSIHSRYAYTADEYSSGAVIMLPATVAGSCSTRAPLKCLHKLKGGKVRSGRHFAFTAKSRVFVSKVGRA